MANLKSAIKRVDTNEAKRLQNQAVKTEMRTNIKHVQTLVAENDVDNAKAAYNKAISKIDRAVSKGAIHRNNGNRHKSRLAKIVQQLSA